MADQEVDYLLIGGFAAGHCARALRRGGEDGPLLIVGREPDLPYERPPLSKGYLRGEESREDALVDSAEFYAQQQIEVATRTSVMKLDPKSRTAELSDRTTVEYDQALLAPGANVRRLTVPGCELDGIHYLRTLANSDAIRADAAGKRVVLIGGSYIATEVAASLTELGSHCTMVMLEREPLDRGFGLTAGRFFGDLLRGHGIELHGEDALDRFEGSDGRVTKVVTRAGRELDADAVVVGAGVAPDVTLARGAGLAIGESGGVKANARLQTEFPSLYVAGDAAEYESVIHGRRIRVEHWDVAFNQGRAVAANMMGAERDYDVVPYFFSDISDWAGLEYVGPANQWDVEVVRGSVEDGAFSVFYLNEGRVAGALSVGRSEDLQAARRLIISGGEVSSRTDELADLSTDLERF